MAKYFIFPLIILCVFLLIIINKNHQNSCNKDQIIDSLNNEILILKDKKDSINTVLDTIFIHIKDNDKHYEENSNIIINNNPDENYLFFTKYIEQNKSRFDSIYNI